MFNFFFESWSYLPSVGSYAFRSKHHINLRQTYHISKRPRSFGRSPAHSFLHLHFSRGSSYGDVCEFQFLVEHAYTKIKLNQLVLKYRRFQVRRKKNICDRFETVEIFVWHRTCFAHLMYNSNCRAIMQRGVTIVSSILILILVHIWMSFLSSRR